jgi:hypothetical protein
MTTAYDAPHDELEGRYWGPSRIALGVVVVALVVFWGWIYLFAPRDNPDRLATRSFAADAETICAPLQAEINALPLGNNAETPQERARQVEDGTVFTIEMVAALVEASHEITDADDDRIVDEWLDDWAAYVQDREAYVTKLDAAGPETSARDLAFTLTERASGGIYTRRIDGLANVNNMASCHVPGDV